MKKLILIIMCLFTCFIKVNAANLNLNVSSNLNRVLVGNTFNVTVTVSSNEPLGSWEYTISYDSKIVKLTSGEPRIVEYGNGKLKSKSYNYTFKALRSGNAKISTKAQGGYSWKEEKMGIVPSEKVIRIITNEELIASYSKDNYLKSLTIDNYKINPVFSKDVLEYSVNVPNSVEKVKIKAEVNDNKSSLSGDGEKDVSEGDNKFEILVTAENGSQKKYILNVIVQDPNPITVELPNGKKGVIVKRISSLEQPSTYKETKIKINNEEIPAFISDITNLTLVGIKNENNDIKLYIYDEDEDTYTLYNEISFNGVILFPKEFKDYPKDYAKYKIKINEEDVIVYKYKDESDFYLIYGQNIETGEEHLYQYDSVEKTLSRYNDKELTNAKNQLNKLLLVVLFLSIMAIILIIILIIVLINKNKMKKMYKSDLKNGENEFLD